MKLEQLIARTDKRIKAGDKKFTKKVNRIAKKRK